MNENLKKAVAHFKSFAQGSFPIEEWGVTVSIKRLNLAERIKAVNFKGSDDERALMMAELVAKNVLGSNGEPFFGEPTLETINTIQTSVDPIITDRLAVEIIGRIVPKEDAAKN